MEETKEYQDYRKYCAELSRRSILHSHGGSPVVFTAGVNERIAESEKFAKHVLHSLKRYNSGDWGNTPPEDQKLNSEAIKSGRDRLMASYEDETGKIWIITEWDRSVTTILFPFEY